MNTISSVPTDAALELASLDHEERAVSQRRRELHEQIDEIYLSAPLGDEEIRLLDELENLERSVSARRRELHVQIDQLRARAGLPRWREAAGIEPAR